MTKQCPSEWHTQESTDNSGIFATVAASNHFDKLPYPQKHTHENWGLCESLKSWCLLEKFN